MIKPTKFEEQVIFYCKLWFELPNTNDEIVEGMKKIISRYYWLEIEHINEHDVFRHLLDMTFKFVSPGLFQERLQNLYKFRGDTVNINQFIKELFALIQGLRVEKNDGEVLIEMTEPDYTLMPKRVSGF